MKRLSTLAAAALLVLPPLPAFGGMAEVGRYLDKQKLESLAPGKQ